jgi:hypothetical protein
MVPIWRLVSTSNSHAVRRFRRFEANQRGRARGAAGDANGSACRCGTMIRAGRSALAGTLSIAPFTRRFSSRSLECVQAHGHAAEN